MRPKRERLSPLACDLTALTAEQRARHRELGRHLRGSIEQIRELPGGYAFGFRADTATCLEVAEFITLERLCCPFLNLGLEVEADQGPLWLLLTGREGVKAFLRAELGIG